MRFRHEVPNIQKSADTKRLDLEFEILCSSGRCHMRDDRGFSSMNGVRLSTKAFMILIQALIIALPSFKDAVSRSEKRERSATPKALPSCE